MELDDLKKSWSDLNQKMDEQQRLNEKLLLQITQQQSNYRFNKIITFEIVGIILNWCVLLYVLLRFQQLDSSFLQVGAIGLGMMVVTLTYLSCILYQKISKIDLVKQQMVEVIQHMSAFKKYYFQYKKWSIVLTSLEVFFLIPLIVKLVHHKNILEHLDLFAAPTIVGLVIGFGLLFVIYKRLYEKSIEEVEEMMRQ